MESSKLRLDWKSRLARRFLKIVPKAMKTWLPDPLYLSLAYRAKLGQPLRLDSPVTFNDKLQWLKLHDRKPFYTQLADKYEVRAFIAETVGAEYLVPVIGVYDQFDDIDFAALPEQFVLKCTHDSGSVVICKDKATFDVKKAKAKLNRCLRTNYYWHSREWCYKDVKPRIICEPYLEEAAGVFADYKFLCFNGEPRCAFVYLSGEAAAQRTLDVYGIDWQPMPCKRAHCPLYGKNIPKPKHLEAMLLLSRKLAKELPFVRVDFYEIKGRLYVGELTLYPGAGFGSFEPEEYDYLLGSWLELPQAEGHK